MSARLAALEAVAEAARDLETALACRDPLLSAPRNRLRAALDALDALPAEPAQDQTVTLAMWRSANGEAALSIAGSDDDVAYNETWRRLGTVTLPIVRERGE